jgi:hypothetical protein
MKNWFKNVFKKKTNAKEMQDSPEPWVNVVSCNLDKNNPKQGFFELEWNPAFVKHLIANGFYGPTPEAVVDQWFTELCSNVSTDGQNAQSFIADAGRLATTNKTKSQV